MEEQGLVVINDNFLSKITKFLRKKLFRNDNNNYYLIQTEQINKIDINIQYIKKDREFVQSEIVKARSAFRKYVINNKKNISLNILNYIEEKLYENQCKINKIIEINKSNITFEEIQELLQDEKNNINNFKYKDKKTGCYQVPIGVIGVECSNVKDCIKNMLKPISTRNSIIILNKENNKYSTESLILLIIKECIRNFYIDDNIIQMHPKEEIDISKLDKYIDINNKHDEQKCDNIIYMYEENELFESDIIDHIEKLKSIDKYSSCEFKVIKGEFGDVVNFLNKNKVYAMCMYTHNSQKAYKFINWVNCRNVFLNTGIKNCKLCENSYDHYFNFKYVLHEGVF